MEKKDNNKNLKDNDLRIGFSFTCEDKDGLQIDISDQIIFKSILDAGMIDECYNRINKTIQYIGYDYFMKLLRKFINEKIEYILSAQKNLDQTSNIKYIEDSENINNLDNKVDTNAIEQTLNPDLEIE